MTEEITSKGKYKYPFKPSGRGYRSAYKILKSLPVGTTYSDFMIALQKALKCKRKYQAYKVGKYLRDNDPEFKELVSEKLKFGEQTVVRTKRDRRISEMKANIAFLYLNEDPKLKRKLYLKEIAKRLKTSTSNISIHLRDLRKKGLLGSPPRFCKWSEDEKTKALALREEGKLHKEIAYRLNRSLGGVELFFTRHLKKHPEIKKRYSSAILEGEALEKAVELYLSGMTMKEIVYDQKYEDRNILSRTFRKLRKQKDGRKYWTERDWKKSQQQKAFHLRKKQKENA